VLPILYRWLAGNGDDLVDPPVNSSVGVGMTLADKEA
jgi:hypothetical protein